MTGWRKRTIMEMAQETMYRMNTVDDSAEYWTATDKELEAFAKLVREDERELCAKRLEAVGCDHCAANIRLRGKE
jgi:flagellar biosynthesis chaperone FliJ